MRTRQPGVRPVLAILSAALALGALAAPVAAGVTPERVRRWRDPLVDYRPVPLGGWVGAPTG